MLGLYDLCMKRQLFLRALVLGVAAGALFLASCSTTETRISNHPEIYQSLSSDDQALVSQGQIRIGMSQNAVWLAWGSADQRVVGNMRGRPTETWIYVTYTSAYPYGGYGYPYGGYGRFYGGFGYGGFGFIGAHRVHRHHHRSFVFFGDPFYDPFYYSHIPPSIPVPYKTVTFSNGRVVSFQSLVAPYR
jgi:hypothetical protein